MTHRFPPYLFAALAACTPTDTGNPVEDAHGGGDTTEGGLGSCDEERTELSGALDEVVSELGFSPQEVLTYVVGEHRETLAWLESSGVTHTAGTGRTEISLNVEANGAPRLVRREPAPRAGGGEIGIVPGQCADSLEIPVRIQVATEDGVLDEVAETVLQVAAVEVARGRVAFDVAELAGSFDAQVDLDERFVITSGPSLGISLRLSATSVAGEMSISTEFESVDGSAVGQGGSSPVAQFPADGYCGLDAIAAGADQSVRGLSIEETLAQLEEAFPVSLSGSDATLEASFDTDTELTCVQVYASEASLAFDGRVTLASSDTRVDGSFPVRLEAQQTVDPDSGESTLRLVASASDTSPDPAGAARIAAAFGIREPIDFSGYDGGYVELVVEVVDGEPGGSLRAYGLDVPDCVTSPPEPSPDGSSSPGCPGPDRIEVWGVDWGR